MATPLSVPLGPLVSFASQGGPVFAFEPGTTKLLAGWHIGTASPAVATTPGRFGAIDRWGGTLVGVTFDFTWEYLLRNPIMATDLTYLQTRMDALLAAMQAGQVGTLTVRKYASDQTVSGTARFLEISATNDEPTWKKLNVRFLVGSGLS